MKDFTCPVYKRKEKLKEEFIFFLIWKKETKLYVWHEWGKWTIEMRKKKRWWHTHLTRFYVSRLQEEQKNRKEDEKRCYILFIVYLKKEKCLGLNKMNDLNKKDKKDKKGERSIRTSAHPFPLFQEF